MSNPRRFFTGFRRAVVVTVGMAVVAVGVSETSIARADGHPRLLTSATEAAAMRAAQPLPPLFQAAVNEARASVDPLLAAPPDVPQPVDGGGGYTHERHKANGVAIYRAGQLYLLTGDSTYADFVTDLLGRYADLYPTLGRHPVERSSTPGRMFWQTLNETVWLVYAIQGYDAIYDHLDDAQRARLERDLFRPLAAFLSTEQPGLFNRIHNYGTWAVAAVGMTGYVIGDEDMVHQALYGLGGDGDGGFLRQLDELFSPDGYYSEGPYYQRYALMPFVLFAQAIERNDPERKIFEYRDGILPKAIDATVQLSYASKFFPINDAIKAKGLDTPELIFGVAAAWVETGDTGLFPIARDQGRAALNGAGFQLAQAEVGVAEAAYNFRTMNFSDGPKGDWGQLSVLRSGPKPDDAALVFKATAQGMGHGHFDRLAYLYYDNGNEVLSDYGAARFLNVVEKRGGHYLPENQTYAKQTVAHHTLVVDGESQFGGDWKVGQAVNTTATFFEAAPGGGIAAAEVEAWDGVTLARTVALLKSAHFEHPLVIDRLSVAADQDHDYDLPIYYQGQLTATSHPVTAATEQQQAVGEANGYQHLWRTAATRVPAGDSFRMTWLNGSRFYSWSVLPPAEAEVLLTRTGAGDPEINLRSEPGAMVRVRNKANASWFAVLESHGNYDSAREFTTRSASAIERLEHFDGDDGDVLRITAKSGDVTVVAIAHDNDPAAEHRVDIPGQAIRWTGYYSLIDLNHGKDYD